ncbi:syntaxin-like [Mytilus galloprovincialis]|uniref:syntaxin-like n=1 Tax=Mytilus galloprovincialis TaxID=29158 RepID=UPI003F7C0158
MVKDRLAELQEKHVAVLIEEAESTGDELAELPTGKFKRRWSGKKYSKKLAVNEFLEKMRTIEDNLKCLRRELDAINKLQTNLHFSPFKDDKEIHRMQEMGKNLLIRAGKLKAEIEDLPNTTSCKKESDMQQRVQNNHIDRLMNMLRDLVIEFKTNQGKLIDKSKEMCSRQRAIVAGSTDENIEDDDVGELGQNQQVFTGNYISTLGRARRQLQSIKVRERELKELEGQISELNELFKTMHFLVVDQGTKIDTIETNVNQSVDYVQTAEKQLEVAVKHKRQYDKRVLCIVIVVIIGLAIIGVIIGVSV